MKKPFEVSDRVAVYYWGLRDTGRILAKRDDEVTILPDNGKPAYLAHVKQCRRLKPRKARTFFILDHNDSVPGKDSCVFHAQIAGPAYVDQQRIQGATVHWIEVKEVRPAKDPAK